eukprot:15441221-Alexandrium_andersonii.AAC.1
MLVFSISVGATRFDRFDSLLGSIGTRLRCHRVPPWKQAKDTAEAASGREGSSAPRVGTPSPSPFRRSSRVSRVQ